MLLKKPTVPNKKLYNGGSEWQNDYSNLPDYYQTFNRNYDAAIGRFISVDPAAESVESMSSYQYAGDNPVMNNDPMGDRFDPNPPPSYGGGFNLMLGVSELWSQAVDLDMQLGITTFGGGPIPGEGVATYYGNDGTVSTMTGSTGNYTVTQDLNNVWHFTQLPNINEGLLNIGYYPTNTPAGRQGGQMIESYNANNSNFNPKRFVGYNFIQVVSENGGAYKLDNKEPWWWQNVDPFYYNAGEQNALDTYEAIYSNYGPTILFIDSPSVPVPPESNYSFSAETTLVGVLSNGQVVPIASFSWGYSVTNGNSEMTGAGPVAIPLPNQISNIIQNYNYFPQISQPGPLPGGTYSYTH